MAPVANVVFTVWMALLVAVYFNDGTVTGYIVAALVVLVWFGDYVTRDR